MKYLVFVIRQSYQKEKSFKTLWPEAASFYYF